MGASGQNLNFNPYKLSDLRLCIYILYNIYNIYSGTSVFECPCICTIRSSTKKIELELFQLSTRFRYSTNHQIREKCIFVKE